MVGRGLVWFSGALEHLKDLEHGPPPEGGNVILDEFFKETEKLKMRENPKTQDPSCDLPVFFIVYQKSNMILWSIRTFWYQSSAENKKTDMFAKRRRSLKNSSLKLKV